MSSPPPVAPPTVAGRRSRATRRGPSAGPRRISRRGPAAFRGCTARRADAVGSPPRQRRPAEAPPGGVTSPAPERSEGACGRLVPRVCRPPPSRTGSPGPAGGRRTAPRPAGRAHQRRRDPPVDDQDRTWPVARSPGRPRRGPCRVGVPRGAHSPSVRARPAVRGEGPGITEPVLSRPVGRGARRWGRGAAFTDRTSRRAAAAPEGARRRARPRSPRWGPGGPGHDEGPTPPQRRGALEVERQVNPARSAPRSTRRAARRW